MLNHPIQFSLADHKTPTGGVLIVITLFYYYFYVIIYLSNFGPFRNGITVYILRLRKTMEYILLWVQPMIGTVMSPEQLDTELEPLHAGVSFGIRRGRNPSLSAVRLFGVANETEVSKRLRLHGYSIVDREVRKVIPLTDTPLTLRKGSIRVVKRTTKPPSQELIALVHRRLGR